MIDSIVISTCALGLTLYGLYATRRHNRLSVRPHLSGHKRKATTNEGLVLSYEVSSDGLGPARIKSFTLLRDGKPIPRGNGEYVWNAIREQVGDKLKCQIRNTTSLGHDTCLRAGESRVIGEVHYPGAKPPDEETINQAFRDLNLRIEYESFYGEKFVFDTRD